MDTASTRKFVGQILHVEDDDDDAELTTIGLAQAAVPLRVHRVKDGIECLAFLKHEGDFAGSPRPDIILLDLNLPRMDGREVLDAITQDPTLCKLPVVVFTTSAAERDVSWSYQRRCSSYVVKPVGFEDFQKALRVVTDFWFDVATLPVAND
ncbi:response regulator [Tahibacter soli]|uniref:Response regulator n=1 Tax=Tahibacter soli TaxID=2983605 RepID=A0A9X4BK47_9GAMM|nr:response regulator [Tahibacter soli]MDC8012824.1 response regulator [Tahibacter soli]